MTMWLSVLPRHPIIAAREMKAEARDVYMPHIRSATARRRYRFGSYTAVLLDQIESVGAVEYLYIFAVRRDGDDLPCLFVASEASEMPEELGGRSHFLGVFDASGHYNLGASDEWANMEHFASKALSIVIARLNITEEPRVIPSDGPQTP